MLRDELKETIRRNSRSVVLIVGAGVPIASLALSPTAKLASWSGLIESGIRHCEEINRLDLEDANRIRALLGSKDSSLWIAAAESVTTALGGSNGGEFRRWLRNTAGLFAAQSRTTPTLEAIRKLATLGVMIATVNYDEVLEKATGLPAVTWKEPSRLERVLRGQEQAIVHLHGFWDSPESVVLGTRSYDEIVREPHTQEVMRSLRMMCTLVFVGHGGGLADPNWLPFLKWTELAHSMSEFRHYRLCRDSERERVQAEHPVGQRIIALPFGPDHNDLGPFLLSLIPEFDVPPADADTSAEQAATQEGEPSKWLSRFVRQLDGRRILRGMYAAGIAMKDVCIPPHLFEEISPSFATRAPAKCGGPHVNEIPWEYEGEVEEPTRTVGREFLLERWLRDAGDPAASTATEMLLVIGEVGSGKSELLAYHARSLAAQALCDTKAPLPFLVDAKDVEHRSLVSAIAERHNVSVEYVNTVLTEGKRPVILMVDGLDEVPLTTVERIENFVDSYQGRPVNAILTTRPTTGLGVRGARHIRLSPWTDEQRHRFEHSMFRELGMQNAGQRPGVSRVAISARQNFENPLAATLAVLVEARAAQGDTHAANRTLLYHSIFGDIFHRWHEKALGRRSTRAVWDSGVIVPLGEFALQCLRRGVSSFDEWDLRVHLARSLDGNESAVLSCLKDGIGIISTSLDGLQFSIRGVAEYLAARYLLSLENCAFLLREVADSAWGGECARHTLSAAAAISPQRLDDLIASLVSDAPHHRPIKVLRRGVVVLRAASDTDAVSASVLSLICDLAEHLICDETSIWVSDVAAIAVREAIGTGNRVGMALLHRLFPLLMDPRTSVAGWWTKQGFSTHEELLAALRHRDRDVRIAAILSLTEYVDLEEVRECLILELLDTGYPNSSPALAAGHQLRACKRDGNFSRHVELLRRTVTRPQEFSDGRNPIITGAAALALRDDEGSNEEVCGARERAAKLPFMQNIRTLKPDPGRPNPSPEPNGQKDRSPVSGFLRWSLVRAIAPGLHLLPEKALAGFLDDNYTRHHALSHELLHVDETIRGRVLPQVLRNFCRQAVGELTALMQRDSSCGEQLAQAAWQWVSDGCRFWFPMQALEPYVAVGHPRATAAYLIWLERYFRDDETVPIADSVLQNREVAEKLEGLMRRGCNHIALSAAVMRIAPGLWRADQEIHAEVMAALDRWPWGCFRHVLTAYSHVQMPQGVRSRVAPLIRGCLLAQGFNDIAILGVVHRQNMTESLLTELRVLVDAGGTWEVRAMAGALVAQLLSGPERVDVSSSVASGLRVEDSRESVCVPKEPILFLIRAAPDAWRAACERVIDILLCTQDLPSHAPLLFFLVELLPLRERAKVMQNLRRVGRKWPIPWMEVRDGRMSRLVRIGDLVDKLYYETGGNPWEDN